MSILLVYKGGVLYVSGTYHLTSTVGYQLRIADLVIKVIPLSKVNIGKGATMQPIITNQQDPTRNAQIHHMQ
jgi:hypothetical protein